MRFIDGEWHLSIAHGRVLRVTEDMLRQREILKAVLRATRAGVMPTDDWDFEIQGVILKALTAAEDVRYDATLDRLLTTAEAVPRIPEDQVYPVLCTALTLMQAVRHDLQRYLGNGPREGLLEHTEALIGTFLDDLPAQAAAAAVAMTAPDLNRTLKILPAVLRDFLEARMEAAAGPMEVPQ